MLSDPNPFFQEQYHHLPIGVPFARKLSDRTNVYAIAATIFELWQGRTPGFWACDRQQYQADESSDESSDDRDLADLPPKRDSEKIWKKLTLKYKDDPLATDDPSKNGRNNYDSSFKGPNWVYLWELEHWKPSWLLRNTATHDRNHWEDNAAAEKQWYKPRPLQGDMEHKLADILRQCLDWNADGRPSIRKLRDTLKDAIEELKIKPSRTDSQLLQQHHAWLIGGLLYPMGEEQVEFHNDQDAKFVERHERNLVDAEDELYRRAKFADLRPAPADTKGVYDWEVCRERS